MCKPLSRRPLRRRRRGGSVLILVVALLVLIALIGTAWIATSRTDRVATRQHAYNTQIDMLLEGVVRMATAQLEADLFGPPGPYGRAFRPPVRSDALITDPYEPYDHPAADIYLADRIPVLPDPRNPPDAFPNPAVPLAPAGANNPPIWRYVSWPLVDNGPSGIAGEFRFDRPDDGPSVVLPPNSRQGGHFTFAPTSIPFNGQPAWPALMVYYDGIPYDPDGPGPLRPAPLPAADVDGDGIADAALWQLPVGTLEGITYYAAVRVIDNNAAVNLNTALSRDNDFVADGTGYRTWRDAPSFFTSRVGLAELLRTRKVRVADTLSSGLSGLGAEMDRLNVYRFNGDRVAGVYGTPAPFDDPVGDDPNGAPVLRPDFVFMSVGEALERQLADRLYNPGYNTRTARYRPVDAAQGARLAYHFCVRPSGLRSVAVEQALYESLHLNGSRASPVLDHPFRPDEVAAWFDQFDYDAEIAGDPTSYRQRRPLLVDSNPLATQMSAKLDSVEATGGTAVNVNEELVRRGCAAPYGLYSYFTSTDGPAFDPVLPNPPRASINNALFPVLWRNFWNVMTDTPDGATGTPIDEATVKHVVQKDPYFGCRFDPVSRQPLRSELHPALMFRSSIRDVRDPRDTRKVRIEHFAPFDEMVLRAALAAVNAEDIRDSDDDVTDHLIKLQANKPMLPEDLPAEQTPTPGDQIGRAHDALVWVYGTECQPYITEVYVNTDRTTPGPDRTGPNVNGYVAIELHNPYDKPVVLSPPAGIGASEDGWSIGLINRHPDSRIRKPFLRLENLDPQKNTITPGIGLGTLIKPDCPFPRGTTIPPHGYLVLENYDPTGVGVGAATHRPAAVVRRGMLQTGPVGNALYIPHLHRLLADPDDPRNTGGEFVLLRTRNASAVRSKTPPPPIPLPPGRAVYDETIQMEYMIPVDQFDFTGLVREPEGSPNATAMHYVRPNALVGSSGYWRFVYPGRYDGRATNGRHQGMLVFPFRVADAQARAGIERDWAAAGAPVGLGEFDLNGTYSTTFTIQLNNTNFGGINPLGAGGKAQFPFGAFARDADILQVPFIGAYIVYSDSNYGDTGLLEMNSVTMDAAFAEDTDTEDDPRPEDNGTEDREQVGRFCPVAPGYRQTVGPNDYDETGSYPVRVRPGPYNRGTLRYQWASDLLDYFTVRAPSVDYFPDVAPYRYPFPRPLIVSNSGGTPGDPDPFDYESPDDPRTVDIPDYPYDNIDRADDYAEDLEPIEGLVNVNTASWKVLASLPLVLHTTDPQPGESWKKGEVDVAATEQAAKAIVYYRDVDGDPAGNVTRPHGPFKSLCELNRVVDLRPGRFDPTSPDPPHGFWDGFGSMDLKDPNKEPDDAAGDLSPYNPAITRTEPGRPSNPPETQATDHARRDFEERYLTLARISNLVTTRSDAYTCYVLLQGWRDAGTPHARLVVQRRLAFVADRSRVSPLNPSLIRMNFYND